MNEVHPLKKHVIQRIDQIQKLLWGICQSLYDNPETAFQEHYACTLLTDTLAQAGYIIECPLGGLETAFRATHSADPNSPAIAILAEYDALPGMGHACGHNLIAASAVGAALGLKEVLEDLHGQVQVIGTPAEEGGGGKIRLAQAGVFQNIQAAMMFHPASKNMVLRGSLASAKLEVEFFGKASHAAAAPEDGINALEALLLMFNGINALRQHFYPKDRITGIITHGGEASNIIPAYTAAKFSIRGKTKKRRDILVTKVIECARAGAQAIGCQEKHTISPGYAEIIPNRVLAHLFANNLIALGRQVEEPSENERMGSTDMGDLSYLVPSIHPYLAAVNTDIFGHSVEFREACMDQNGKTAMLDAAKALAMTTIDLLTDPTILKKAREELDHYLSME